MPKLHAAIPLLVTLALVAAAAATYGVANSQSGNGKYDTDGDRLIEIEYLEQFNAIRYDLNGNGKPDSESGADSYAAAFPTSGNESVCQTNCNGYELNHSLDFDDRDSYTSGQINTAWTTGSGWLPIGVSWDHKFDATFDGNEHTVANLYINRVTEFDNPGAVGLFAFTGRSSTLRNIGVLEVDVTGVKAVGGLVGHNGNGGTIIASYATGRVLGKL